MSHRKTVLFAIGALCAAGCSREYAEAIAERVMVPGATLDASDEAWLAMIHAAMRTLTAGLDPRWSNAN